MEPPAIPDIITVVGSSYFQPIADLIEIMLSTPQPESSPSGAGWRENGYAASITILLVAVLESYTAHLRFVRNDEISAPRNVPDLLAQLFPDLPHHGDLLEVFLLRNLVVHNHIWHLDVSDPDSCEAQTLKSPLDLGFDVNKHYSAIVDPGIRRTRLLGLHASPTAVDRTDVKLVFEMVWSTLSFMHSKNFSHTPLAGRNVKFRGKRVAFETLRNEI